jgi:phage-related protein
MRNRKKPIEFVGSSLEDLRSFPRVAIRECGYQLDKVQEGEDPDDWKPFPQIGKGVKEIRVACEDGAFRVFYVVSRPEAIYVLHAFRKTTQKTEKRDVDLAAARFRSLK